MFSQPRARIVGNTDVKVLTDIALEKIDVFQFPPAFVPPELRRGSLRSLRPVRYAWLAEP
ncbi:MAG: hypothetical protein WBM31_14375, partial [Pseudolabrys sp.]|jgi:hypothetical protein